MEIVRTTITNPETTRYLFADLMDEYGDSVYRFCRSLTYSKEDADDLFQETFLHAFEQFAKISVSDNPNGFLFNTAVYVWKSWKRRYARRNRLAPVAPLDETVKSDINLEESFIEREEARIVRELVSALPLKFLIPVVLYYTVEMGLTDIASTLKIPCGTVKSRLSKARTLIKKGWDSYGK